GKRIVIANPLGLAFEAVHGRAFRLRACKSNPRAPSGANAGPAPYTGKGRANSTAQPASYSAMNM
ncbi:MAG: hypothetical protein ACOYMK_18040, partial [Hyphomonadaceae bacterium]